MTESQAINSDDLPPEPQPEVLRAGTTDERRMVKSELLGRHSHQTSTGTKVHIWKRGDQFLARGSYGGARFGETLGAGESAAAMKLCQLLTDLERQTYSTPSVRRKAFIKSSPQPLLSIRETVERFLTEKRSQKGLGTAQDYRARLAHLVAFSEQPEIKRRCPTAAGFNRQLAIDFRASLHQKTTSANGMPTGKAKRLSPRQIHNILSACSTLLNWARRLEINLLPACFVNPFSAEIVGTRPLKDPLRAPSIPMPMRIELANAADCHELLTLALSLVIPCRPEEMAGLLISDYHADEHMLRFGSRFGGNDYTKGGTTFRVPLPPQFKYLMRLLIDGRTEGPLLRRRSIVEGRRKPKLVVGSAEEVAVRLNEELIRDSAGVDTIQDRKRHLRSILRRLGGIEPDALARVFEKVLSRVRPGQSIRFYDIRGCISTDMKDAGVDYLFRQYVTGHSLNAHILATYESVSPQTEMAKYFRYIEPLLATIAHRLVVLGSCGSET